VLYIEWMGGARSSSGKVAVVGIDGGTFRTLDPIVRAGVMPAFARVRERGISAILRSTIPSYTPPAWVSIATGVNPGRHGVFGFLDSTPQEQPRVAHSGSIRAAGIWRYLEEQGATAGIFNLPMTYPPLRVEGFMVSGGLAAGWTNTEMPNFTSGIEVGRLVSKVAEGHYPLDTVVSYENDWRSADVVTRIEDVQRLRRRVLTALLERWDPGFLFTVFEGVDRLQHVHYQYLVEGSDWYDRPEAAEVRSRSWRYFGELDAAIDDIAGWVGDDGHIILVSDHGAGPWEKTLNVNLLLRDWGYLGLPSVTRVTQSGLVAGAGQRIARRVLPRRLLLSAKARIARDIRWSETQAFASQVAEQGIHINHRDAFPNGQVDQARAQHLADELSDRLHSLTDPSDGLPTVDRVFRREEVIRGPYEHRAPDLFPLLRDQRYELSDTLAAGAIFTDHRDRPWGYHHLDGIFVAAGPNFASGTHDDGIDIVDVLPTVFSAAGYRVPAGLDGRAVSDILTAPTAAQAPAIEPRIEEDASTYPYTPEEEAAVEESLRGLGYID
jgi:predicted AlkP superfamily phosphohydrolase/phosphomutase